MDKITIMLSVMWLFMAASGVFLYKACLAITVWLEFRRQQKNYPGVGPADKSKLCKEPHVWNSIKLAIADLPVDKYRVCVECGLIAHPGSPVTLNKPGMDVYLNNIRRRAARDAQWNEAFKKKQDGMRDIMNAAIKSHVPLLGTDLGSNVKVLESFFHKSNLELDSLYSSLNKTLDETGD